ncbi:hypothetical protein [Deinococcus gobiensis]|uniref:hypothetical protein n=2 Tax=Deinococcus TaxID=1298 RepID=UPI0002D49413|nr:hypothetical protein [Deinococcus gobiensis]
MRKLLLLSLTAALSAPALAWVPKLEDTTAKNVIDGAYGRRDPVTTYQTLDLSVKDGKFAAGDGVVRAFDGGDACVADWLAAPTDYGKGSRLGSVTLSGQADQLYFQAVDARDSFKNLSVKDALGADYAGKRLADGELRVDIAVRGLPSEKARDAYLVRLKAPDGKMVAPARRSYVSDFKQDGGTWSGTLVYYFKPLEAGLGASDKVEMLVRTEADTSCAYSVSLNLGSFN